MGILYCNKKINYLHMKQVVKEKRSGKPTLIRSTRKEGVKLNAEATKAKAQIFASNKNHKTSTDVTLAEKSIDTIIDFFNQQALINNDFESRMLSALKIVEFAYPNDYAKLQAVVEGHTLNINKTLSKGMKTILDAFTNVDSATNFEKSYYQDMDFIIETPIEHHQTHAVWVEQTIEEPWFKN
jgi:hypothetical protein